MNAANDDGTTAFDPDFGKTGFARHLFRLRFRDLKLTQKQFAARYGLGYPTIKALEQGTTQPTPAIRLIVAAIACDPEWMADVANNVSAPCQCGELERLGCCLKELQDRFNAADNRQ